MVRFKKQVDKPDPPGFSNGEYTEGIEALKRRLKKSWALLSPPPNLTTSEWADEFLILPDGNAEPGPWRTSRAPYQKEMMDVCDDPAVNMVTFMTSAQIGKTICEQNVINKRIHLDPCNIMFMHPTAEDGKDWMNFKFEPVVRECKELDKLVPKPRSRDKTSTQSRKEFPGGYLMVLGSNAARALRGRSAPLIICDEIDGFETGKEGDQILLLWNRAKTFYNKLLIRSSTPVFTETSRILQAYESSDQRRYYIPCPHCGHEHILKWENFKWDSKEVDGKTIHKTETAHFVCPDCGGCIEDKHKSKFLHDGKWVAKRRFSGHAGFKIWEAYSPWVRFKEIADAFLVAKHTFAMQTFWNTALGEAYDIEKGEHLDHKTLFDRREDYEDRFVPMGAGVLTAGADIQADRIEVHVLAHGHDGEVWVVDYQVFFGDPNLPKVWTLFDDYRTGTRWTHESGVKLKIEATCVDAGYLQTEVLKYTGPKHHMNVFAIKGVEGQKRAFVNPKPTRIGKKKARLYQIGVDTGKDTVYARLKVTAPGPGFVHFNKSRNEDYFEQLTSERKLFKYSRGFKIGYWSLPRGKRNEALDTFNYAMASFELLNVNMDKLFERLHRRANELIAEQQPQAPEVVETIRQQAMKEKKKAIRRPRKKGGFANRF